MCIRSKDYLDPEKCKKRPKRIVGSPDPKFIKKFERNPSLRFINQTRMTPKVCVLKIMHYLKHFTVNNFQSVLTSLSKCLRIFYEIAVILCVSPESNPKHI